MLVQCCFSMFSVSRHLRRWYNLSLTNCVCCCFVLNHSIGWGGGHGDILRNHYTADTRGTTLLHSGFAPSPRQVILTIYHCPRRSPNNKTPSNHCSLLERHMPSKHKALNQCCFNTLLTRVLNCVCCVHKLYAFWMWVTIICVHERRSNCKTSQF